MIVSSGISVPGRLARHGPPRQSRKQLGPEEQEKILRYAKNYLGYKETYLAEKNKQVTELPALACVLTNGGGKFPLPRLRLNSSLIT